MLSIVFIAVVYSACEYNPDSSQLSTADAPYYLCDSLTYATFEKWSDDKYNSRVEIVAVGQSTHGSSENIVLQAQMFKYWVQKYNCRLLCIEAPSCNSLVINQYVHGGELSRSEIVSRLSYWTWRNEEIIDLIEWIRAFNLDTTNKEQIDIEGVDFQLPQYCAERVVELLEDGTVESREPCIQKLERLAVDSTFRYVREDRVKWEEDGCGLSELLKDYQSSPREEIDITAPKGMDAKERISRALMQSIIAQSAGSINRSDYRDSVMAENVTKLVEAKHSKGPVFILAHNDHIKKLQRSNHKPMGWYLNKKFGNRYVAIATDFIDGSIRVILKDNSGADSNSVPFDFSSPDVFTINETPDSNSLKHFLKNSQHSILWIDLDIACLNDNVILENVTYSNTTIYNIGAVIDEKKFRRSSNGYAKRLRGSEDFNELIIFKSTSPTRAIKAFD